MENKDKSYINCKLHPECRKVKGNGDFWEMKKCPWCGYQVSTSNIGKWCAMCYCMFRINDDGYIHFGKKIQKTTAEAWAIAIAKSGGAKIGGGGK